MGVQIVFFYKFELVVPHETLRHSSTGFSRSWKCLFNHSSKVCPIAEWVTMPRMTEQAPIKTNCLPIFLAFVKENSSAKEGENPDKS